MKISKDIILVLSTFILTSCNFPLQNIQELKKSKDVISFEYSSYNDNDFKTFLKKYDSFASDFSGSYIHDEDNFIVSPLSLYMAMSLVVESTANNTRNELLNILGMSYDEVLKYTSTLYEMSTKEYKDGIITTCKEFLDSSIWFSPDISLKDKCLESLANNYYCSSYAADFLNNNEKANNDIRKYIKDKTNGLIDKDFNFDDDTKMILMNTLYVKDIWGDDNLLFTNDKYEFKNHDNSITNTKLLTGKYNAGVAYEDENYRSFYTTSDAGYSLRFMVPQDGKDINDIFTKENIDKVIDTSNYIKEDPKYSFHTMVYFPEFEVKTDKSIKNTLIKMGINDLYNPITSDFSNISSNDLVCTDTIQVAKLIVNKKGFEGAAVTEFEMKCTSVGPEKEDVYYQFYVDRSFGFVLTDCYNNVIFSGIIYNI